MSDNKHEKFMDYIFAYLMVSLVTMLWILLGAALIVGLK